MLLADALVVAVEEHPEARVEGREAGLEALEQEGLEEPGDVREVPLRRAGVGHRLHLAVLGRERRGQRQAGLADRGVALGECGGEARASGVARAASASPSQRGVHSRARTPSRTRRVASGRRGRARQAADAGAAGRSLECRHGLRPPAHAHRVFGRRRHAAHRRGGRRRGRRRPGGAGDHRPRQPVRRGQVLQRRAQAPASSRSSAPRSGSSPKPARRRASRLLLLVQNRAGYLQPLRAAVARLARRTRSAASPGCKWEWLAELGGGLIALSGAELRRGRPGAAGGDAARARGAGASGWQRCFRQPLLHRAAAHRPAERRGASARGGAARAPSSACRSSRRTRCSSSAPDDHEAHEARVCVAEGEMLANPRRVKRFTPRAVLQDAGADGGAVRRPAERARQHASRSPSAATSTWCSASRSCPTSRRRWSTARRCRWPSTSGIASHAGPRGAAGAALSRCRRARARAAALRRAARLRDRDDPEDGLSGLLPDRRRLHQLGAGATAARSARAAARAPARWWPTRSTSPASTRCATTCCSSAS